MLRPLRQDGRLRGFKSLWRGISELQPGPPLAVTGTPQRWEDIEVGSLVLASTGTDEGWFEAIIAEARGDAIFVLRWQGWPDHDAFVRRADGLALLPAMPVVEAAAGG